jgi:serine/threonine protein kinase
MTEKEQNIKKKIKINKVANRFLPLTESVINGLEPEATIKDFTLLGVIGEGSFGKVSLVRHNKTGSEYAIKQISKLDKNNQEGKTYFRREIEIMYKIHQNNIVRLFNHFEDNEYCYFVMEYIENGNLFSQPCWKNNKCFSSYDVAKIIKEVICAVYYLHNMDPPIIHRDIKPENVLLDKNGVAKLTDFGWSNYIDSKEIRRTYCGTPVYLAPEMIKEIGHDEHLDIWCIGVLLFELLTGNVPFKGKDLESLNNNILSLKIAWPKDINLVAKNLILKILKPDPGERISLKDMLKHPFFRDKLNDDNLERDLIKPDGVKYPPFLMSKYSIEYYDKMIIGKFLSEKKNIEKEELSKNNENETNTKENESSTKNVESGFLNSDDTDKKSLPMNSIKSFDNFPKEDSNNLFLSSDTNSIKVFTDPNNIYRDSSNSFLDHSSIQKSIGLGDQTNMSYSNLIKDYEKLNNNYNELLVSKQEQNQKLEECNLKINLLLKEKQNLMQEVEEAITEKLKLKTELEETKQQLKLNEFKIKNIKNINDSNKGGNLEMEKMLEEKNEEIRKLKEKMSELEKNNNELKNLGLQGENKNVIEKMEEKLKSTKSFYEDEIKKIKADSKKDKDNFTLIIKVKDDEIRKLVKNKEDIKAQEGKKYEKIIAKYEQITKDKDTEIEILRLKNKKLNMINKIMQSKQEKSEK